MKYKNVLIWNPQRKKKRIEIQVSRMNSILNCITELFLFIRISIHVNTVQLSLRQNDVFVKKLFSSMCVACPKKKKRKKVPNKFTNMST